MKKWMIIVLCLLLCLAFGCGKGKSGETVATTPEPTAKATDVPTPEPTAVPKPTEAPEPEPTAAPEEDHSGDIELPELGGGETEKMPADLEFDTQTMFGDPIKSDVVNGYDLVIVNFWAEWCGPCVAEIPALERLHQDYPNVLIIGVWIGDDRDDAKAVLTDLGVTYPVIEMTGSLYKYGALLQYIPATFFFDGSGDEIGEPIIGGQDYTGWKTVVDSLLP